MARATRLPRLGARVASANAAGPHDSWSEWDPADRAGVTTSQILRLLGEVLGLGLGVYALFVGYVGWLSTGTAAFAAWVGGYVLAPLGLLVLRRTRSIWIVGPRVLFDLWLVAGLPALLLVAWAHAARWPIEGRRSNAHGWGTSGGEGNLALLPLVQTVAWLAAVALIGVLALRAERATGRQCAR